MRRDGDGPRPSFRLDAESGAPFQKGSGSFQEQAFETSAVLACSIVPCTAVVAVLRACWRRRLGLIYGPLMEVRGVALGRMLGALAVIGVVMVGCSSCTSTSSESWSDPSVSSRDSRVLTVMAHGSDVGDGACSLRVHLEATESDSMVTVRAITSRPTFDNANCAAVLEGPRPFSMTLKRALGDRAVVDAETGATELVLDGSVLPTITGLPSSYVQRSLFHDQRGAITRFWSVHRTVSYPGVVLAVGPPGSETTYPGSRTAIVAGRKVEIWSDGGDTSENFAATWSPKPGEQVQITVSAPTGDWTEAKTLALVAHTKRL